MTSPPSGRLTRGQTPLARLLRRRGLSYDRAAQEITSAGSPVSGGRIAQVARGAEPSASLARAIVVWSVGDLSMADLIRPPSTSYPHQEIAP